MRRGRIELSKQPGSQGCDSKDSVAQHRALPSLCKVFTVITMKVTLAIALVAVAAASQDTQPPVISLDLANYQFKAYHPKAKNVGVT